jgi:hypothetical protein
MKNLLVAAALILPTGAYAEPSLAEQLAAVGRAAQTQKASQGPAAVDAKPLSVLLDKVVRDGVSGNTLDGPGVLLLQQTGNESLILEAVETRVDEGAPADGRPVFTDLVYRRAFTHLIAVRQISTPADNGLTRRENWVYRLAFDGRLYPVVHQVLFVKPGTGSLAGQILSDKTRAVVERQPAQDPAVQKSWTELIPRLIKLARTYEA